MNPKVYNHFITFYGNNLCLVHNDWNLTLLGCSLLTSKAN